MTPSATEEIALFGDCQRLPVKRGTGIRGGDDFSHTAK
jgi:hypothetical protein